MRPRDQYEALRLARTPETSEAYRVESKRRAGTERTISQGVRCFGLRRTLYVGETKSHLQQIATATVINAARISNWLEERPREATRRTAFTRLMAVVNAA
jgi:transposase